MSTYRGTDGFLSLGGAIDGAPQTQGAVAQGATSVTIDGGGSALNGVLRSGDTFTVAGDATVYTVASDVVIGATTANEATFSFTPSVVPAGGWADNAAVTFASNLVAGMRAWSLSVQRPEIETTEMGDAADTYTLDVPNYTGSAEAWFDKGDAEQEELVNQIKAGTAPAKVAGLFGVTGGRQLWGDLFCTGAEVTSEKGALVSVNFSLRGTDAVKANWK